MGSRTCILVRPPVEVLGIYSKPVESLALAYLAAAARADGHRVELVDSMLLGLSVEETVARVRRLRPDVVGITNVLNYVPAEIGRIAADLRAEGFTGVVLAGGHSTSFLAHDLLLRHPAVDAVVAGEGESAIRGVLHALAAGADWREVPGVVTLRDDGLHVVPPRRETDLDALPAAARDLTPQVIDGEGLVAVSTSRGCYARCTFCSVPRFFGLHRPGHLAVGDWVCRSAAGVVEEILGLHRRFGIRECLIVDDEFFGGTGAGRRRAEEIADLLAAAGRPVELAISCRAENVEEDLLRRLAAGGLAHVFVGLESGVDEDLRNLGKGISAAQNKQAVEVIKRVGLSFQAGFMLFQPGSTISTVRRSLAFLQEIDECKPATFNTSLDPHAGTPALVAMQREEVLEAGPGLPQVRYADPAVAAARAIAAACGERFQPYMNLIGGLQSAITYEWRRPVPGRSAELQLLVDRFERSVNDRFASVLLEAVASLDAAPDSIDAVRERSEASLDEVDATLAWQQALVVTRLAAAGQLRYQTQRDRMDAGASW